MSDMLKETVAPVSKLELFKKMKTKEFLIGAVIAVVVVAVLVYVGIYLYKKWKASKNQPQPIVPQQPKMKVGTIPPPPIEQTNEVDAVVGISDDDMRSLCAHIKKDKNAVEEIITSSDFSELLNTEQACEFAKHQYIDLEPIPRGTGKAVPHEEGIALSKFE
jgi:hypothetical protein